MQKTFNLSSEHVGAAITRYVGMKLYGTVEFRYHIADSSWAIQFPLTVTAQERTERQPIQPTLGNKELRAQHTISDQLTRNEVIEAIWFSLPLISNKSFNELGAADVAVEIPEVIEILVSPVPRDAHPSNYRHELVEKE